MWVTHCKRTQFLKELDTHHMLGFIWVLPQFLAKKTTLDLDRTKSASLKYSSTSPNEDFTRERKENVPLITLTLFPCLGFLFRAETFMLQFCRIVQKQNWGNTDFCYLFCPLLTTSVLLRVLGRQRKIDTKEKTKYLLLTYSTDTPITLSRTSHAHASFHRNLRQEHQSKSVSATSG